MIKEIARPLGFIICTITICILAVAVSAGCADPPAFVWVLLGTSWEWPMERAIRKGKEKE